MKRKALSKMSITVDARMFADIVDKPYIIKFDGRKSNLSEIGTENSIEPAEDVLEFISKATRAKAEHCPINRFFNSPFELYSNVSYYIVIQKFTNR